jgi:segregation and condensation protein B
MLKGTVKTELLAILFTAREPVTMVELAEVFPDLSEEEISKSLGALTKEFNALQEAVEIRNVAGGFRLTTRPEHHEAIRQYLKTKPSAKLSQAALETLSVIAYKQPVTLPEILEIRGVKGTSTIRTLLEKKLIEMRGRKKIVGRPIMYGTTQEFLVRFGLSDLSELPSLEEFEELYSPSSTDAG